MSCLPTQIRSAFGDLQARPLLDALDATTLRRCSVGEAILALHYFVRCASAAATGWLVTHARNQAKLAAVFSSNGRIHFGQPGAADRAEA